MVRCRVISCNSDSEKKIAGVSFHSFPGDPHLRKRWIEATGRKDWVPTKYCKICSKNFSEKLLIKKNKKTVLYPDAVPNAMIFFGNEDSRMLHVVSTPLTQEPIEPIQISTLEESAEPVPSTYSSANLQYDTCLAATSRRLLQLPEQEDTPRKKKLKAALRKKTEVFTNLRKKIRAVRQTNRRLIKKNAQLTVEHSFYIISELKLKSLTSYKDADILSTIDTGNKDFLKRFLGVVGKAKKYSAPLRKFALCLHFISPRAYFYVRKQFNMM